MTPTFDTPLLPRYVDSGSLKLLSVIGTGAYGVVYLAEDTENDQRIPIKRAVKALQCNGLDERQLHFLRREVGFHLMASGHPNVVRLIRLVEEKNLIYVVMEYGEEGDLYGMITDEQRYIGNEPLIRLVFLQLIDALIHLHSLNIAHRDIKPENIVCSNSGTRLRICDFGLATSENHSTEMGCGSTFYIAPERLGQWSPFRNSYPTKQGDIWSLGIILINLVCGRNPWRIASPNDESFQSYLDDHQFLKKILPLSEECFKVLEKVFVVDPLKRITLLDLREEILKIERFGMTEKEVVEAHLKAQQ
ncbi:hypothetical protein TREMEDRAFT_31801, partial [Tremella mesenterica DSM 1558]|uniref:uncharacterized protein n=1 Tax=Tremella mesenterica (strain ATCC 24925 / CBS 8224 / DSM 1558 / NBRC 9311 / NRRL Y-6157 / RJB 2259-6 / UBC 559-6) TaxID=578456 RepID=UPI0003F4A0C1